VRAATSGAAARIGEVVATREAGELGELCAVPSRRVAVFRGAKRKHRGRVSLELLSPVRPHRPRP
jgi:hypothetical protein